MRDVAHQLRVANSQLLGIMTSDELKKELLQRMLFRNLPDFVPPQ
jgi:hypothetical protein